MVLAQISVFSKHPYTWKTQFTSFPKFCPTSLGAGEEWIYEIQRHPSRRQRDLVEKEPALPDSQILATTLRVATN